MKRKREKNLKFTTVYHYTLLEPEEPEFVCLFVLGLGLDVNHGFALSLCLTIVIVFAEFPGVLSSLCDYVEAF